MGDILFLSHRIPFPPDRGDKIRSHNVLKRLAQLAPVHVATFADDDEDFASRDALSKVAASDILVRRSKPLLAAAIEALVLRKPLSLTAFHDGRLKRWVEDTLNRFPIDAIYVFSGQMAQYVPKTFKGRVVVDLVDVDSAKFEAYAAKSAGLRRWMERRETRLLSAEEALIASQADATLLISEAEADLLRSRVPQRLAGIARIHSMANGLDSEYFDPASVEPEPRMMDVGGPRLIFTGQMDYAPNVDAVLRAIDRIMPAVRSACPGASFHVVGRNPAAAVKARDGVGGVHVWGRVDDVRPWLAAADVALVPLEIARGVQNKVLEAMAMGVPVVLTPGAATGIDARNLDLFLVAETDAELISVIVSLARDRLLARRIGAAARDWIVHNASWDAALARLPEYVHAADPALDEAA
jgi:sugar transferase (PEP-CTERM/EpsH1 system associated)